MTQVGPFIQFTVCVIMNNVTSSPKTYFNCNINDQAEWLIFQFRYQFISTYNILLISVQNTVETDDTLHQEMKDYHLNKWNKYQ